ncbi:MAG TPA: hypothetical protein VD788_13955 [Candidatus Polarisedimenticolaceae bacterium]|nr:hypothetical protein [Candidatus Polarisedimenticolaceae bacterium]
MRFKICRTAAGWCAALTLGLSVTGTAPAQTADASGPPEPIQRHLVKLSRLISTTENGLKGGPSQFRRQTDHVNATPAWSCCSNNLKAIEQSAVAVQSMLQQLDNCYQDRELTDQLIQGRLVQTDLQSLAKAIQRFADAPTVELAQGMMPTVTRSYLNLTDSAAELAECGELLDPSLVATSESETSGETSETPPRPD